MAGHLTGGRSETPGQLAAPPSPVAPTATPRVQRPPGTGAARTPEGAARAAARALSSLADPLLLSSRHARRVAITALAAPGYRPQLEPLFARTYGYLSGLLGSGRSGDVVLRMTPIGYRVEAFSGRRASVAIWQVTLLATPGRAPISAWSTSRAELTWASGHWQIERFDADVPGPVPSVTAPSPAGAPAEFVAAARGFSPFRP